MDTITLLYTSNGLIFGIAFLPQIISLMRDKSGAISVNLTTWGIFSLCSIITLLYAYTHNGDSNFIFCSIISMIGNICVLFLGGVRRLQYATVTKRAIRATR